MDSQITLTNNEIEDTIKVIKPLENGGIVLKGTSEKVTKLKGGFHGKFLSLLMKVDLD